MTLFYFLIILHIVIGLFCAHLVRASRRAHADSWFLTGTILGGVGLLICWLRLSNGGPHRHQGATASS